MQGLKGVRIALRLQAGNTGVIQVDVGDDGSPDFSFARGSADAINVRGGDGPNTTAPALITAPRRSVADTITPRGIGSLGLVRSG